MNYKLVSAIALNLALSGCMSITAPENVAKKNAAYALLSKQAMAHQESAPNVYNFNTFYVPELDENDYKLPVWVNKKVGRSFDNKIELGLLLDLLQLDQAFNVEYREGVDRSSEITVKPGANKFIDYIKSIEAATGYKVDVSKKRLVISKYVTRTFPIRTPVGSYSLSMGKKRQTQQLSSDDFAQAEAITQAGDEYAVLTGEFDVLNDYIVGVEGILGCKSNEELSRLKSAQSATANVDSEGKVIEKKIDNSLLESCEAGAKVKAIKGDNSIFVKALPSQMSDVEDFIADKTERELRQVKVLFTLVAIEKNTDTAFSFDADLIDKTLAGVNKLALETVSRGASSLMGGLGDRGTASLSHVNGTSLVIENLAKQGTILDKTFMIGVSTNNRIAKFTDANKISLIIDRPVNSTANVGTEKGVTQKVVKTGRILYMLPNIGESDVVLNISSSLSSLKDIVRKGGEGSEVESPETSDREIEATVKLQPNKPKIIGGFAIDESQSVFAQTGLTGRSRSSRDKEVHVVMLAEAIME